MTLMSSPVVPLSGLLVLTIGFQLWITGVGQLILLWPFGVRPMFSRRASLEAIYGMDPATCDINEFIDRHSELWKQAEKSRLPTLNKSRLGKAYFKACTFVFPRMQAATKNLIVSHAKNRATLLELIANLVARVDHKAYEAAVDDVWRTVLVVGEGTPSEQQLQEAYDKALLDAQGNERARKLVKTSLARARLALHYV
jgi:hypothetical protein